MMEPNKTRAHIALFTKDEHGYGLGCELIDDRKNETYFIFSLYLSYAEYPNKTQVLNRVIPVILAEVPDCHVAVTLYSTILQFRKRRELIRRNSQFAVGKALDFKILESYRWSPVSLAIDAVERRSSITEHL